MGWSVLKTLVFLPVLGAMFLAVVPVKRLDTLWRGAVLFAFLSLLSALQVALGFDPGGVSVQMQDSRAWNARLGSYFSLGIDGLSLAMVLLTAALTLVAAIASRGIKQNQRLYFVLLLLLESAMYGVFTARDWSLFYVFWEATLIPLFFLIDRLGGANRQRAALNFFLYTLAGSVLMLVSLLFLYDAAPGHSFAMTDMAAGGRVLPLNVQILIFAGLLIGFGVKMPIFPLHGWLPLAHVEAPGPVSILLSGVLLKMGAYGLFRAIETLPSAALTLQPWLGGLGMFTLLYGAMLAWRQQDLKAMVAYSSVSHMGLVLLGLATLNQAGVTGAIYQMVAHGFSAGLMFLLVTLLYERTHTRNLAEYGSLKKTAPALLLALNLGLFASMGFPFSAGFIAEIHVLLGGVQAWGSVILLSLLGMLISAAYGLRVSSHLSGEGPAMHIARLRKTEWVAIALLFSPIVVLGLWPQPVWLIVQGSLRPLISMFGG